MTWRRREQVDDLVVVIPGILGSRLAVNGSEVWALSGKAAWNGVRTFGKSVKNLTLPADIGDDKPSDGVVATGLMPDLHFLPGVAWPVDGYSGLVGWLERKFTLQHAVNLIEFPYDWRLSCRYNAGELGKRVCEALGRWRESAPGRSEAKVTFVCHSMGGLIARFWVEALGGAEVTRKIVTLGTPHRGSLDALASLVNGFRLGKGPVAVDLSPFARSLPSLYQLTPDYACLEPGSASGLLVYPREYGGLPGIDEEMLKDAGRFHAQIRESTGRGRVAEVRERYAAVAGVEQPTPTTAVLNGRRLIPLVTIEGTDHGGDGRVSWGSATPYDGHASMDAAHKVAEQHGSLQNNGSVRDAIWTALTSTPPTFRGPEARYRLGVSVSDYLDAGDPCEVAISASGEGRVDELMVTVEVRSVETEVVVASRTARNLGDGRYATRIQGLAPGAYRVRAGAEGDPDGVVTAFTLVGESDGGE